MSSTIEIAAQILNAALQANVGLGLNLNGNAESRAKEVAAAFKTIHDAVKEAATSKPT